MKRSIVMMAIVASILSINPAAAAPRCPNGGQPDGKGRCVYVWRGGPCVRIGGVVWCSAPGRVSQ